MFAAGTEAMPESYRFDTVKGDWFRQDREVVMDKRIAIVTGSALGLGYELTRQLIERGWFVCGVDFNAANSGSSPRRSAPTATGR